MAEAVNTFVDRYPESWIVEPEELGALLKSATLQDAGLKQKDVAELLTLPENTVSRWWQGKGLKADQFAHLFGLMRASRSARNAILTFVGIPVSEEERDLELQRRLSTMTRAHRAARSSRAIRTMLQALEDLVDDNAGSVEGR